MNAWKNREKNKDDELKMLAQLTMKPYTAYEELCGVESCQKKREELKRNRDDSQVLFETKRIRVIKLENDSRGMCVVMYIVCINHSKVKGLLFCYYINHRKCSLHSNIWLLDSLSKVVLENGFYLLSYNVCHKGVP